MATVNDILTYLETLAPRSMKMDWDNVGLLCGSRKTEVTKILVALDPFEGVCREAASWGADLMVTHHPLIFQALKSTTPIPTWTALPAVSTTGWPNPWVFLTSK